jgi:hypothetical protein
MTQAAPNLIEVLERGEIIVKGKFLWGSNYTFLVDIEHDSQVVKGVYKPTRGERPLWDFPAASLAHREVAAFLVSQALGWDFIPETVYRRRGPVGAGSLQRYIEHDSDNHYFNFDAETRQRLRPVVLFDLLVNNADRKGGHVILDYDNKLWLIDHGICFHAEDKLRTVIWDFAGEPIPNNLLQNLKMFLPQLNDDAPLGKTLSAHLSRGEIKAMAARGQALLDDCVFPNPDPDRRPYPWPPL